MQIQILNRKATDGDYYPVHMSDGKRLTVRVKIIQKDNDTKHIEFWSVNMTEKYNDGIYHSDFEFLDSDKAYYLSISKEIK
ncbi:MAG: hypothetical protein LBU60_04135 [Clostridiales bacterium]|jgi:hypothetical protein|nr:hypothetical protein [Clostridiales bacterium]